MLFAVAVPSLQAPPPVPIPASIPSQLSLEEALNIFRSRGLDLLIAQAGIAQAEGDLRVAGASPSPQIGLSTGKSQGFTPQLPGQSDRAYGATISEGGSIVDSLCGHRKLRISVAEAALRGAKLGREDALRTVGAQVKIQFLQMALAKLNLDLSTQTRDAAHRTLELVKKRFSAGTVSEVDVSKAQLDSLATEQVLENSRQALEVARANLAFLLGERSIVPSFETIGSFEHPKMPTELAAATPESLLPVAREHRPDLLASKAQLEKSEAALSLAKRDWVPDSQLSLGVSQQGTGENALQPRTWTLGLNVILPSPRRVHGEIARASADIEFQRFTQQKIQAQVAMDLTSGWFSFQGGRSRLTRMEGNYLEQSKKVYDLVTFQYERGAASLLEVLDAQRT